MVFINAYLHSISSKSSSALPLDFSALFIYQIPLHHEEVLVLGLFWARKKVIFSAGDSDKIKTMELS
jgi:hypothetical protein